MTNASRRWTFRPRYSLRTLFIVMTVACVVGGHWLNEAVRQQRAVHRFHELSGAVLYRVADTVDSQPEAAPRYLRPLIGLIGEEAFGEVIRVRLPGTSTTSDDLRYLTGVPTVEGLWLQHTRVTDEGLPYLRACPKLRALSLSWTPITDRGLTDISKLNGLEFLSLNHTWITDAGLVQLKTLTKLKGLWLVSAAITDEGYRRLQADLPECEIYANVPSCKKPWGEMPD